MFHQADIAALIDQAGVLRIENGWQVVIRATVVDCTPQQPHGLDYAIILQDAEGVRVFGFDNAHSYDGATEEEPWDHEHKPNRTGQAFKYDFRSAGQLLSDFFDRLDKFSGTHGMEFRFIVSE